VVKLLSFLSPKDPSCLLFQTHTYCFRLLPTVTGGKASKHLFCVSKAFLKLSTALSHPLPVKLLTCFRLPSFTVSGSYLGTAATVWRVLARLDKYPGRDVVVVWVWRSGVIGAGSIPAVGFFFPRVVSVKGLGPVL
jgi:hypothetical protein